MRQLVFLTLLRRVRECQGEEITLFVVSETAGLVPEGICCAGSPGFAALSTGKAEGSFFQQRLTRQGFVLVGTFFKTTENYYSFKTGFRKVYGFSLTISLNEVSQTGKPKIVLLLLFFHFMRTNKICLVKTFFFIIWVLTILEVSLFLPG